jgi:two-component system chemotaxis response regulator CheY
LKNTAENGTRAPFPAALLCADHSSCRFSVTGADLVKRCLIIDDSSVIRKVARALLNSMSYEVIEAANGAEGIAACAARMPDAILLDWDLPDMSGFDFLVTFNREFPGPSRPYIVYATTENDPLDIARAISTGASKYVTVPFNRETLEACFSSTDIAS